MTQVPAFAASLLRTSFGAFASATVARMQRDCPELLVALPESFASPREDLEVRLLHLAAAVEFDRVELFENAVAWYRVALHHRGVAVDYLVRGLGAMADVLGEELPAAVVPIVQRHLEAGQAAAVAAPADLPTCLDKDAPHGLLACRFLLATLEGRGDDAVDLIVEALDGGLSVADLHDRVLMPVQQETGRMWLMGEIQVADEHYGSGVVDRVLGMVRERLPRPPASAPTVLALSVAGDLHDFGLRMIAQRLRIDGFAVHDLGANMPASDLAGALRGRSFDLVAIGATMAVHLHALVATIAELRGLFGPPVPILVGGGPFRVLPDLHEAVGADRSVADVSEVVVTVREMLSRRDAGA